MERFTRYTYNPELDQFNDKVYKRIKILLQTEQRLGQLKDDEESLEEVDEQGELQLSDSEGKSIKNEYQAIELGTGENRQYVGLMKKIEIRELRVDEQGELQLSDSEGRSIKDEYQTIELGTSENWQYMRLMKEIEIKELIPEGRLTIKDFRVYKMESYSDRPMVAALLESDLIEISKLGQRFTYLSHLSIHLHPEDFFHSSISEKTAIDVPFIQTSQIDDAEYGRVYFPFYFDVPEEDAEAIICAAEESKYRRVIDLE